MAHILNVKQRIVYDNSIKREEWHNYDPYASSKFDNNDEVRIPIHHQDIFTTLHDSSILLEGKFLKSDGTPLTSGGDKLLVNNGFAFLFDEIRYELYGVEVDKVKNVGITSTIKGYISIKANEKSTLECIGWYNKNIVNPDGTFSVCLPLKLFLGVAEDYRNIIINAKQELILIRSRNDNNSFIVSGNTTTDDALTVKVTKIQWRVKHIYPSDEQKLKILNIVNSSQPLYLPFRAWDLYEYPSLPTTSKHVWTIKTSTQLEKPRYIILAFQTDKKNKSDQDSSTFNHCNFTNVKLYLNSESYPYENLNIRFDKKQYSLLYDMYTQFQRTYYNQEGSSALLSWSKFLDEAPLIVIDCSKQSEALKTASVDVKLEFESTENFPPNTSAYCLIIHDKVCEYTPLTGIVTKY